jgi:hypothetical protein
MTRSLSLTLAAILTISLAAVGCSSGGSSGSHGGSASTASTTTPGSTSTNTGGTTRGGTTTGGIAPGTSGTLAASGQSNGPTITVTSPTRASFTENPGTTVAGTVTDPTGILLLTINGNPVAVSANGSFSEPLTLTPGINSIVVEATNGQNTQNKTTLSVLYGQNFQPGGTSVQNALVVRLDQGAFNAVGTAAGAFITPAQLSSLTSAPISLSGVATINITSVSFGTPTITLTPQTGDIDVNVVIPNLNIGLSASALGFINVSGTVTADSATINATITATISNGVVTTAVTNDTVAFQNFQFNLSGLASVISSLLPSSTVQSLVSSQLTSMLKTVLPQQINQMIAGATGKPITQTIMGATATITITPTTISFDPAGATVITAADVSIASVSTATPPSAPGSWITSGAAPNNMGPTPDFFASINQDFLNQVGFAVWQSGMADVTVDGSANSIVQVPSFIPLDMGLLQLFIPELVGKTAATDSIALRVAPQLPPTFVVESGADPIEVQLGDLEVQIWDTTTNQLVLSLALQAQVSADPTINAQNVFDVTLGSNPFVDVSLVSSPLAPSVNTIGLDNFVGFVVPPVLQTVGTLWAGFPVPVYQGLTITNTTIVQDGAQGTFITAKGDVN